MFKIIGKLFLDFTKIIFAGVVVGAIMRQDIEFITLLLRGISAMMVSTALGLTFYYYATLSEKRS